MDTQRIPEPPTIGAGMMNELLGADMDPSARRKLAEKALAWSRYVAEMQSQSQGATPTSDGMVLSLLNHRLDRTEDKIDKTSAKIDKTAEALAATITLCQEHRDKRITRLSKWVLGLAGAVGLLVFGGPDAVAYVTTLLLKLAG